MPEAKHPKGLRGYALEPEERLLAIGEAMIRLADIKFESEARRTLRPGAPPRLNYIYRILNLNY